MAYLTAFLPLPRPFFGRPIFIQYWEELLSLSLSLRVPNPSPVLDKNSALKFYPVLGLVSGGRLLGHFQTLVLYWMNFRKCPFFPSLHCISLLFSLSEKFPRLLMCRPFFQGFSGRGKQTNPCAAWRFPCMCACACVRACVRVWGQTSSHLHVVGPGNTRVLVCAIDVRIIVWNACC